MAPPFGKVGIDVTVEEAYNSARLTALSILGSLKRESGRSRRVLAWLRVFGMVNAAPGFQPATAVINGFSDLIVGLFRSHTRQACESRHRRRGTALQHARRD